MCFVKRTWRFTIKAMVLLFAHNRPFPMSNNRHFGQVRQICMPANKVWTHNTHSAAMHNAPAEMGG